MTCDTARILLLFYRPGKAADLAADDFTALEAHLATCPACAARVGRQTAADAAIGRAFRQVAVPDGLKARARVRAAAAESRLWRQTWATRAATAALVLAVGLTGWGGYVAATRPVLNTWALGEQYEVTFERPDQAAREWLAGQGVPQPLPEDFDPALLTFTGYADVQGVRVPVLEYRAAGAGFARVYLLRPGQFSLKDAAETQNSFVTVRLYRDRPAAGWTAVVVHTGNDLQPFLRRPGTFR